MKPYLVDFEYTNKNVCLCLADSINRKAIYPLFHGRKVIFYKNSANEMNYLIKPYKWSNLSVLFFVATLPLLALTMTIKFLSKENKLKFKEIKEINNRKKTKVELKKKAREDAHLKRVRRRKQKRIEKENLKEAKLRIQSPKLGKLSPKILSLAKSASVSSSSISLSAESDPSPSSLVDSGHKSSKSSSLGDSNLQDPPSKILHESKSDLTQKTSPIITARALYAKAKVWLNQKQTYGITQYTKWKNRDLSIKEETEV